MYVRVEIRVGNAWVPAHLGVISKERAQVMKRAYKTDRPNRELRLVPEESCKAAKL